MNESLTGWLGLIFAGIGAPAGATIDTPVPSGGQDCVKCKGLESNTNSFGDGPVTVWVTQPPCLLQSHEPVPLERAETPGLISGRTVVGPIRNRS